MKLIDHILSIEEIKELQNQFGSYAKVTVEIEKEILVVGCELHADGEQILLEKGGKQDNIWGGGIDFATKIIDATAVLNLRPRLQNNSIELLDQNRKTKFINIVRKLFVALWEN